MPHNQSQPYIITARTRDGIVQQTRTIAASAVVLAISFREAGYTDVEVTDPMGNLLCQNGFRDSILSKLAAR